MKKELVKFSLRLDSKYAWGTGMSVDEFKEFNDEVIPKLTEHPELNFRIIDVNKRSTSPSVLGDGEEKVYLHPMEFAGYLPSEKLETLQNIIKQCDDSIVKIRSLKVFGKVTAFTPEELKNELEKNRGFIKEELRHYGVPAMNSQIGVMFVDHSQFDKEKSREMSKINYNFLLELYEEIEKEKQ